MSLSSCSEITFDPKKISEELSWDISDNIDFSDETILYECNKKETFYIKFLDEGRSIWVIFSKRELKLFQDQEKLSHFSNGTLMLKLDPENTLIRNNDEVLFENCKQKKLD